MQGHWYLVEVELLLVLLPLLCLCYRHNGGFAGKPYCSLVGSLGVGMVYHLLPGVCQPGCGGLFILYHLQLHLLAVLSGKTSTL